jgi:predicted HicB family RNase H-like nuclease
MALNPPPEKKNRSKEKEIDKIINQGAGETAKEEWKMITLRLPELLLRDVDFETEKRIGLSRNAWILEAIQEKLKE